MAAQLTTASVHGTVKNEQGQTLGGAVITATGVDSGFVKTVTADQDGSYTLGGITPGTIKLTVSSQGFEPQSQTMQVLVGQSLTVNFVLSGTQVIHEIVTVIGHQAVDMTTPEAATNVTPLQIASLPQDSRNFLNFAALAPGVQLSKDPLRKTFSSGAQPAERTNVYIDGVSFKNDVLQGGIVGQDSSRGNPFPQNAVQEFRVITQNYSAQYAKASSAIITAVTKSGGNVIHGNAFWYYQPKKWVAQLPKNFQYSSLSSNTSYRRNQPGFSIGGPIIKDKLHYFFSYEGVDEHATNGVTLGNASYANQFGKYTGVFASPFKSNLAFGKLSWQPAENQEVDWSGTYRREHETRDFGGQTSYQSATDLKNWVYDTTIRHQWNSNRSLNQASLSWQSYGWNPTPLNPGLVGQNYEGVIRIGGNSTTQKFDQRRIELRDDFTIGTLHGYGDHTIQVGGNFDAMHYKVNKSLFGNPEYDYRNDPANGFTFAQPYQVQFGFGNPILSTNNNEFGAYGQDTWAVNDRLTLTLGLRYDYETHEIDKNYVTPPDIVAALTGQIPPGYFSNGHNRSNFSNEWQPRLAFSYDVKGTGDSVIFGGFGRYYDRIYLNSTLDERYRLQYPVYNIQFSPDGRPGTIKWDPSYMTVAGLYQLINSGKAFPEIHLLYNDTKPPYSDQWNLGYRQRLGSWVGSISYNQVRGYHGMTWVSATGICCSALVPGYGAVILSDPQGKDYWYHAFYVTFDRPYANGWQAHIAWTHGKAEQNGNDLFSLDYPSAAKYPRHIVPGTERDHIIATGIVDIPWHMRLGATINLGTGAATDVLDFSQGFSLADRYKTHPFSKSIYPPKTWGFAERSVDLRLEKMFAVGPTSVSVIADVFNLFNWADYGCLNNFIAPGGNPSFGQPGCVTNLGRREQLGLKVSF